MPEIIPYENIKTKIYLIRGQKVMIDRDLARLYGVDTKVLNQAVKRNRKRFPDAFIFRLTKAEKDYLVTICDHLEELKYSYQPPYAFTEHGVAMLSSVLNSRRAIEINITIINTFIKMRDFALNYKALAEKINELEAGHKKHDKKIVEILAALRLMAVSEENGTKEEIGFKVS